jgi:hypothetical protein
VHRTIEMTVPLAATATALKQLEELEHVVGLSVERGASIKPPGDVLTIHTLNRGADDVLKIADHARRHGTVSVVTSEVASIIDPEHEHEISNDVDEGIWEEMEIGLRHQGRITPNYLALMALGGGIGAIGLVSEPVPQAIALVAASVIAPGFEPIAKIALGIVLHHKDVLQRGLTSMLSGYLVLMLAAAATFLLLRQAGAVTVEEFVQNPEVKRMADPMLKDTLQSAFAAAAGLIMIAAYRRSVIAGPLMALILIPAAAMAGIALAVGQPGLSLEGLARFGLDVLLIVVVGSLVLFVKQATIHRHRPRPMASSSVSGKTTSTPA